MKELNHRVGNNFHFMMSVQNMQAHSLNSLEALNAITQSNSPEGITPSVRVSRSRCKRSEKPDWSWT